MEVLTELGALPESSCYLGDSEVDMQTGKAAFCLTVGVTWGYRSRDLLREEGADWLIDRPEDLLG